MEKFVNDAFDMLKIGGRMSIITFHSLEDRLIKNIYKNLVGGCICPSEFPVCMCGRTEKARIITKKPIIPTDEELQENARARSAKLRVIEKI